MSATDPVLLPAEVAERLRRPVKTLAYWRSTSYGPRWFRIGRKNVGYMQSDVEAWLSAQRTAQQQQPKAS